jgi:hypothetical protein
MKVLYITNIKRRLIRITLMSLIWLLLFIAGSSMFEHIMLFRICIEPYVEFSYPYGLTVEKIMFNQRYADPEAITAFSPSVPGTEQFTSYESVSGDFSFDYPSVFQLETLDFQGGEILYHIAFKDKENVAQGFVQVWTLEEDLETFLERSIAASHTVYKYFNVIKKESNGREGILWDYSAVVGNGYIKGSEFFVKSGERMYRLSFFVPEEKWDKRQKYIFENMLKSLKIK